MSDDNEHGQPGGFPGEARDDSAAARSPRRAWATPRMHRISLQRTLAGSGVTADAHKATSALPT